MHLQESIPILGEKFQLFFIENEGMAFGMSWGGETGKLALSLFRLIAVCFIGYFLLKLLRKAETRKGLVISMALILAGAFGNIIDSVLYGLLFEESSPHHVARFLAEGGGYAPLLHGKVVDMLYFPLFTVDIPHWVPIWGGSPFQFFQPVFNLADSSITIGVLMILIWYKRYFGKKHTTQEQTGETSTVISSSETEKEDVSGSSAG